MAYKIGNRYQLTFLPPRIEDYVSKDDPVRIYDTFVDSLSMSDLGIELNSNKVGNSTYDPRAMLKLLLYGYSYGWRSSRKLERAIRHNVSFMWLMSGLKPNHKTIANFRRNNKVALKKVLTLCVGLCIKLDLIEGNTLFVDGTKMRANASISKSWSEDKWIKHKQEIEKRIEEILQECENMDQTEENKKSLIKLKAKLQDKKQMCIEVEKVIEELKKEDKKSVNKTDKDCIKVKGRQGTHAGYNSQLVVDEKHGMIVNSDVTSDANDKQQFSNQIDKANKILGTQCKTACGDSGYSNTDNLKKVDDKSIKVIVPTQKQASKKDQKQDKKAFTKEEFFYDEKQDIYICPAGNTLKQTNFETTQNCYKYKIERKKICKECEHFGVCTTSQKGRTITRLANEETKEKLELIYASKEGQEIYKKRKEKVELPFGHIKRNLHSGYFLLRGHLGVNAEMALFSTVFNIRRMMTILGEEMLKNKLINMSSFAHCSA